MLRPRPLRWTGNSPNCSMAQEGQMADALPPDHRALLALRQLRDRVAALEGARREPIGIIGMACRFPGAPDPRAYWRLLRDGISAVREVPSDRWRLEDWYDPALAKRGRMYVRHGGFLDDVRGFDAAFFNLSPREAAALDPQHRLLLELAWEAFEDAGLTRQTLAGSRTGVFVALDGTDYAEIQGEGIYLGDAYTVTGNIHCAAAGRVAHVFDLGGPCEVFDTACSSSLVAVHRAMQALRDDECDLAIAGGVNLMLSPLPTVLACQLRSLAPDGRCKAFDAAADGYVRGEGGGLVVLKRRQPTARDGDRVHAWLRGSAVNHDGRAAGLTQPNPGAQARVLRAALAAAGIAPLEVGYIEAHGSGTALGDPIEFEALHAVYGENSAAPLCAVGSVKTNLGHLEAAAGIAGLLKAVLALQHETIPPHLNFSTLNPRITLHGSRFQIPPTAQPWRGGGRCAGVSAFGISGTNAHILVQAADPPPPAEDDGAPLVLAVTAHAAPALAARAAAWATRLDGMDRAAARAFAAVSMPRRSWLGHRLAVAGADGPALAEALRRAAAGPGVPRGKPLLVFCCPGHGGQRPGMLRELVSQEPTFRAALARIDTALVAAGGPSATAEIEQGGMGLDSVPVAQPVLFAVAVALAELLQGWGIRPDAVVGHSLGEVAAGCIAGALSLADAARVIVCRSALLGQLAGHGGMAVAGIAEAEARELVIESAGAIALAAVNGPESCVLSGPDAALDAAVADLQRAQKFARRVRIDIPAHSPAVDALLPAFRTRLGDIRPQCESVPIWSTGTGARIDGTALDTTYWARNLREPVLLGPTVDRMIEARHGAFLELAPHPVLLPDLMAALGRADVKPAGAVALGCLRRDVPDRLALRETVAALFRAGVEPDPVALTPDLPAGLDLMPLYPWQRVPHWVEAAAGVSRRGGHGLFGAATEIAGVQPMHVRCAELGPGQPAWLADHRVDGTVLLPAAAVLEAAAACGAAACGGPVEVVDAMFAAPVTLEDGVTRPVQLQIAGAAGAASVTLFARDGDGWSPCASAGLRPAIPPAALMPMPELLARCHEPSDAATHRAAAARFGLTYGPAFQAVAEVRRGDRVALARLDPAVVPPGSGFLLHPALLDAGLQVLSHAVGSDPQKGGSFVPVRVARCAFQPDRVPQGPLWVQVCLREAAPGGGSFAGDLALLDADGTALARLDGVEVVQRPAPDPLESWSLRVEWRPAELAVGRLQGDWTLIGGSAALEARIADAGGRPTRLPAEPASLETALTHLPVPPRAIAVVASGEADIAVMLAAIRGVILRGDRDRPRLVVVTAGAQPVMPGERPDSAQAALWGLARVLLHEHPELHARLIDLPATGELAGLVDALADESPENQIAVRDAVRYVARLVRARIPHVVQLPLPLGEGETSPALSHGHPTILITGAFGSLGRLVAMTLAGGGARRLCLVARRPPEPDETAFLRRLAAAGTEATLLVEDLATPGAPARIAAAIAAAGQAVEGLVHCAGLLRDATLRNLTPDAVAETLAPKHDAAATLARLIAPARPRFVLLFSSAAGLLGTPGQGAHAAASAALDALAATLRAEGLPAVSIGWGPWADTAVAEGLAGSGRAAMRGIGEIPVEAGLAALRRLAGSPHPYVAVLPFDPRRWREYNLTLGDWPFLAELMHDQPPRPVEQAVDLADLRPAERRRRVATVVRTQVAQVFRMQPQAIDDTADFGSLGLDSLMGLEIRNRLEAVLGLSLPATLLWMRPTVGAVIEDLCARTGATTGATTGVPPPAQPQVVVAAPADGHAAAVALRHAQAELNTLLRELGDTNAV
jgi:acyl transferase domain-containing protein/acyl carrier protein